MSVGVNVTPRAVIASSIERLERKMAMIAVKRGTYVNFFSIQRDPVSENWIAWYNTENKKTVFNKDIKNDTSKE
jgi:hypothetical protein